MSASESEFFCLVIAWGAVSLPGRVQAQDCQIVEVAQLFEPAPPGWDSFGVSAAIDGRFAVIGAPDSTASTPLPGSTHVFAEVKDGTWEYFTQLVASDGADYDEFGQGIAISGDFIAIGAWADDDAAANSGSIYIFHFDGANWNQVQKIASPVAAENTGFGYSLAMSGDALVIGKGFYGQSAPVFVYRYDGQQWNQEAELQPGTSLPSGSKFGYTVAIDGNLILVGAPVYDGTSFDGPGRVFAFRFEGKSWVQETQFPLSGLPKGVGLAFDVRGDRVVMGLPYGDTETFPTSCALTKPCSATHVYEYDGVLWSLKSTITLPYYEYGGCGTGYTLAIVGDAVLDGNPFVGEYGYYVGAAYLHVPNDAGTTDSSDDCWVSTEFTPADVGGGDWFGSLVASDGETALIVSPYDIPIVWGSGSAYVYKFPGCGQASDPCPPGPIQPPEYLLTDLGTLGGDESRALDLNNKGQVVGWSDTDEVVDTKFHGIVPIVRAFLWEDGKLTELETLETPEPYYARAHAINEASRIVGTTSSYYGLTAAPTLWVGGTPMDLGWSNCCVCEANSISDANDVVGYCATDTQRAYGFIWTEETGIQVLIEPKQDEQYDPQSINNNNQVAGGGSLGAFLWDNGLVTMLPGTTAHSMNENTHIVGVTWSGVTCGNKAFLWRDGVQLGFHTLGGKGSNAFDINELDWIVGSSQIVTGKWHAALFVDGVTYDLNSLVTPPSAFVLESAMAINDLGAIAGHGVAPNGETHGFLLTPIQSGDITKNGVVDVDDLLAVINSWGKCPLPPDPCDADIVVTGMVDVDDLLLVINNWS